MHTCLLGGSGGARGADVTHRARDVRAARPLAVGPGAARTSDLLPLAQQLAVLLLSVLHVDQQRDEAVLHLFGFSTKQVGFFRIKLTFEVPYSRLQKNPIFIRSEKYSDIYNNKADVHRPLRLRYNDEHLPFKMHFSVFSFQKEEMKAPPSRSPARRAGPEPGSAPRCSGKWPSPPRPTSPSAQTRTADGGLRR